MLLSVQWCRGKWLEFVHVLSRAGGFSGIVTADEARAVRAGDRSRFSGSRWFLASAKPGMSSKISRPTSWAGMTGSSSRSGLPVVRSSKRSPRRQHGVPTLVKSWVGINGSLTVASFEWVGSTSPKRDAKVTHGTPLQSEQQVAQGQCRVDSPVM